MPKEGNSISAQPREVEFIAGGNLDECVKMLEDYRDKGESVYTVFNGKTLYSDSISLDGAYQEVTGMKRDDYIKAVKEYMQQDRKESWLKEGQSLIPPEKAEVWKEMVNEHANSLYNGAELNDVLRLLTLIDAGKTEDEVMKAMDKQRHSGASYAMVNDMLKKLNPCVRISVLGEKLENVVKKLEDCREQGKNAYAIFNGQTLYSKDVTLDSAYLKVTGKTFEEFNKQLEAHLKEVEEEIKKEKERIPDKIKNLNREGEQLVSPDKLKDWNRMVAVRVNDLYQGHDVECAVQLMKMAKEGKSNEDILKAFECQNHSGASAAMVRNIVKTFSPATSEILDQKKPKTFDELKVMASEDNPSTKSHADGPTHTDPGRE